MRSLLVFVVFAASACSSNAGGGNGPEDLNLASAQVEEASTSNAGVSAADTSTSASPPSSPYHPTGIVDRVDLASEGGIRSYVWLDTDEDTVVVELTDSSAMQLKSGKLASFGCQSVGLTEVGTTSYTRNAKDYTDCVLDSVADAKDADDELKNHHDQAQLGQALDSMGGQDSDVDQ